MKESPRKAGIILFICIWVVTALTGCIFIYKKPVPEEKPATALDRVLAALQLKRGDLGISRSLPQNDPFLLNKVGLFLRCPLQIDAYTRTLEAALKDKTGELFPLISLAATVMEVNGDVSHQAGTAESLPAIERLPVPLNQAAGIIYQSMPRAKAFFENAFKNLSTEEKLFVRQRLEEFLLPDITQKNLSRRQYQEQIEKTLSLAARIDQEELLAAASQVAAAVDRAGAILRSKDLSQLKSSFRQEIITISTPLGDIAIGGQGNNCYTGAMPLLLIDTGGDDNYAFTSYTALSIIIDVAGNDIYDATAGAPLAAGIMGMGFLADLGGNDRYIGRNVSFGCGLMGVGVLLDESGNDMYRGQAFTQGAGALGLGIVCDAAGNDEYQCSMYGQGFGFVGGCGLQIDYQGDDRFICSGGQQDFREASGAYQSCSQGYGLGCRGFAAGGAGILYSGEGDDIYEGSYFCQGSSYWLSLGLLIDAKGNDRFQARRYSQGAGVHASIGALTDQQGDDVYTSWAVSQGCGHDRSVGMLRDSSGNDRYTAEWLSQGSGNDSGTGLLIDDQGDDTYTAGADGTQGCGNYDERRDEVSIGILADAGGNNLFTGKGKDKKLWTSGQVGGGINGDGSLPAVFVARDSWHKNRGLGLGVREPGHMTRDTSDQGQGIIIDELEAQLITEDSWQKAADALAGRVPAVIRELLEYMDIKDVVVQRTLEETFKRIGKKNVSCLHAIVMQKSSTTSQKIFLLYVLGDIANPQSQELFLKLLDDKDIRVQAMALRGLYKLKACPPIKKAKLLAKSDNVDVRRYLALSLRGSDNKAAAATLKKLRLDNDFNVRYAAGKGMK